MFHFKRAAIALLLPIGVMTACTGALLQDKEEEPVYDPHDIAPIIIVYGPPRPVIHHAVGIHAPAGTSATAVTCRVDASDATCTVSFSRPEGAVSITLENEGTRAVSRFEADSDRDIVLPLDDTTGHWTITLTTGTARTYGGTFSL